MANDRIFIRCTSCNNRLLLTKHYPSMDLGELDKPSQNITDWISLHLQHHPKRFSMSLGGEPGLMFETESKSSKTVNAIIENILDGIDQTETESKNG